MGTKKIPFFDFSAVLDKLQAIADNVHPSATNVAVDPTGMEIITANNSQGALKQLDTAVDSVNSSLTQKQDTLTVSSTSLTSDQTPNPFSSGVTGYINMVKYGRIVCVTAVIKATSATTNLDICTLPSGYRPHATNVWLSSDYYGDTSGCEFRILTDGKLNCAIPSGSVNKDIKVSGSFIASS